MKLILFALLFTIAFSTPTLAHGIIAPQFNLPGPPSLGSEADQADYQTVLSYQNTRTNDDCTRASSEVTITLAHFFGAPYGNLTAAEVSLWSDFMSKLSNTVNPTIGDAKNEWKRPRPYQTHADIEPCIQRETSYSYPSGHSAISELYARALSIAYPERTEAFKARALQIAQDRMIGGVHYPSDIQDGNLLGDQLFDEQNQNGTLETSIHQVLQAASISH